MYGQLGTGDFATQVVPTRIANVAGKRWASISAGSFHTCALDTTFYRYCWGINSEHQLGMIGLLTLDPQLTPYHDTGDGQYRSVDSGDGTSCVISLGGNALECYGKNIYGNIGNGNTEATDDTISLRVLLATSSGGYHACVIDINGLLYCWGHNNAGQLGLGNLDRPADHHLIPAQRHVLEGQRGLHAHLRHRHDRASVLLGLQRPGPARHRHHQWHRPSTRPRHSPCS